MDVDVMVLGAGMVGLSTALHLLQRGRSVALVDRGEPAGETSFGNAGLIQSEAVVPYAFPLEAGVLLGALAGWRTDVRVALGDLPFLAPALLAYARHGGARATRRTALANAPLLARVLDEHCRLMERAGALPLLRGGGYLRATRSTRALERAARTAEEAAAAFAIATEVWDAARLMQEEPHLSPGLAGAIHFPDVARVHDPGDVGAAYAALFEREGGHLVQADARSLHCESGVWRVDGADATLAARGAVIALGPWSGEVMRAQGVAVPLFVKRGYHMHYAVREDAVLSRFLLDADFGYALVPNRRGIRLTTGAEFARRDAPPTSMQVDAAEREARRLVALGPRLQDAPWMGSRPCLPDLLPAIGPVPGRPGLWANFGHHHLGFTLGPATGRLLAEMMTGEVPFTDPAPYRVDRFVRHATAILRTGRP